MLTSLRANDGPCTFTSVSFNTTSSVLYLDYGETFAVLLTYIPRTAKARFTAAAYTTNASVVVGKVTAIDRNNFVMVLSENGARYNNVTLRGAAATGSAGVSFAPPPNSPLACPSSDYYAHVRTGYEQLGCVRSERRRCPPLRRLVVDMPATCDASSLPNGYNLSQYGCPVQMYYGAAGVAFNLSMCVPMCLGNSN